ncbi:retrovirus-related pol polyprotein from transposon TNT 1-94 [Tanacetum coccineum]
MHTFYQHHPSGQRWTKDHPLEQVIRNPSQSIRTRRQLETNGEMCMFALTVSRTEPKNIKEAVADSIWIESMQEELYQFDRLDLRDMLKRKELISKSHLHQLLGAAHKSYTVYQMDVKTSFLYGPLKEEVEWVWVSCEATLGRGILGIYWVEPELAADLSCILLDTILTLGPKGLGREEVLIDLLTLYPKRKSMLKLQQFELTKERKFLNKIIHAYFAKEGIRHETSTARTPEQHGVVKRRNRTLVEAAQTMLSAAKVPLFFWAEAIAKACFTQNCSLLIPRHEKTPYHIINAWKPLVKFFYIFGSLCYIVRDGENYDKMKEKGDACIFVGYSTQSKAYRVFN